MERVFYEYTNADWSGDSKDRKTPSRFMFNFCGILWKSVNLDKQETGSVALPTLKAKTMLYQKFVKRLFGWMNFWLNKEDIDGIYIWR